MKFSILYVNYKSVELVKQSINSFLSFHKNFFSYGEIIVVDNCSGDDLSSLHKMYPNVKIVYNKTNSGFGSGNNTAFSHSNGQFIILVNPDVIFTEDITNKISSYYSSVLARDTDILGGSILNNDGVLGPSYGCFPNLKNEILWFKESRNRINSKLTDTVSVVDMVSGAFCCIPRDVYRDLGGFDEEFFLYYEETDLQYRHYKKGCRVVILHDLKVVHFESSITGRVPDQKLLNVSTGRFLYHKKNSSWSMRKFVQFNRLFISLLAYLLGRGEIHKRLMRLWWSGV